MFKMLTLKDRLEIAERENAKLKAENIELKTNVNANLKATRKLVRQDEMTAEQLLELVDIYPNWEEELEVKVDELYKHEDGLYKVIQGHTTQPDWKPDVTPALFNKVQPTVVIPNWVQPTGAHDAYQIGDKIIFTDGKVYESTINANTWSPTGYPQGWKLV